MEITLNGVRVQHFMLFALEGICNFLHIQQSARGLGNNIAQFIEELFLSQAVSFHDIFKINSVKKGFENRFFVFVSRQNHLRHPAIFEVFLQS